MTNHCPHLLARRFTTHLAFFFLFYPSTSRAPHTSHAVCACLDSERGDDQDTACGGAFFRVSFSVCTRTVMGRNHQQQKRNNTRGPCRFHTKWLWLVLTAAVMGAFGTLEAVTLAQDSVYREAMRPFPELVIASVLRVAHTHAVRLCSRCGLDRCAACNFVGVVGCVVLIARAALCKAADPGAELRGLRSTGFCSYVYTLSSVSLHSIVATYFLTLTSVLLVSFCTHTRSVHLCMHTTDSRSRR